MPCHSLYGAFSKMYIFLKKDAQGKLYTANQPRRIIGDIEANQLENISDPVFFISSTEEYYFILHRF